MKRNLLFHCYPIRGSIWPWHVDQLLRYKEVWNGRRIVTVVTDGSTEPADQVVKAFAPFDAEIFVTKNQSYLAEVYHFTEMLSLLESKNADEATFYAHAKGVTHTGRLIQALQGWIKLLYSLNLSRVELVEKRLQKYPAVGCCRIRLPHAGSHWCYAGTYFWLRHDALFSRNWKDVWQERAGVEGYPGRHFKYEESYSFNPEEIPASSLYNGWITDAVVEQWTARMMKEPL